MYTVLKWESLVKGALGSIATTGPLRHESRLGPGRRSQGADQRPVLAQTSHSGFEALGAHSMRQGSEAPPRSLEA